MKTSIRVACSLFSLLAIATARAQPVVDLLRPNDTATGYCEAFDNQPGVHTINVYHRFTGGALAARFRVEAGPGVTMIYAGETHPFSSTVGNSQSGIEVCYGTCLAPGDIPLVTISYLSFGTSAPCSELRVVPHPAAEVVETMDCNGTPQNVWGGVLLINPSVLCADCEGTATRFPGTPESFSCAPLAAQASTWGTIKALYR
jgi:hypothetical protein